MWIDYLLGEKDYLIRALNRKENTALRRAVARRNIIEKKIKSLEAEKCKLRQQELKIMEKALKRFRASCDHNTQTRTGSKLGYGDEREEYVYSICSKCGRRGDR